MSTPDTVTQQSTRHGSRVCYPLHTFPTQKPYPELLLSFIHGCYCLNAKNNMNIVFGWVDFRGMENIGRKTEWKTQFSTV